MEDKKALVEKKILTALTLNCERVASGYPSEFTTIRLESAQQPITGQRLNQAVSRYYVDRFILSSTGAILRLTEYYRGLTLLVQYTDESWTDEALDRLARELDQFINELQPVPA